MLKVKLQDGKRLEEIINTLLADSEMSEIEKEASKSEGYLELQGMVDTMVEMMGELPEAGLMEEYRDAVQDMAGYEVSAAYLNGIKTGFNLAVFLDPGISQRQQKKGKEMTAHE